MEEEERKKQGSGFRVQEEKTGKQSGAKPSSSPLNPEPRTLGLDKKELRKQRAEARQILYNQTKDFKKSIQRYEAEVERLEKEKGEISAKLSAPADAGTSPASSGNSAGAGIASMGRRLQQVQYEIDIATGKWEKATEELEKVMGAAGGGDGE
jgi:chromosome segregation ATPase